MLGIIGGAGLNKIKDLVVDSEEKIDTPFGAMSAPVSICDMGGKKNSFFTEAWNRPCYTAAQNQLPSQSLGTSSFSGPRYYFHCNRRFYKAGYYSREDGVA